MSAFAVEATGLGKCYALSGGSRHPTLRDALWARLSRTLGQRPGETLWALAQTSFSVRQGETVGVLGRNGAGKSTLLKLLSRVTEPTVGSAVIRGRVGSMLEVGTGFHPELSGRENVFLNGAILGMRRSEVASKFDAIVAFAELERFIDEPVKHYSSGMYVRLAFSVAAHLEPDILLIDEVLAVGDFAFQRKCLERLAGLCRSGLTMFLVSHNLAAIQSACSRVLVFEQGRLCFDGPTQDGVGHYRDIIQRRPSGQSREAGSEAKGVEILSCELLGAGRDSSRTLEFGEEVTVRMRVLAHERIVSPMINLGLRRGDGVIVCNFNNWYDGFRIDYIEGECMLEGLLPPVRLAPDFYEVHVLVWPWAGGHAGGSVAAVSPLASATFGDVRVVGPPLNAHDGVFQVPAREWRFTRGLDTTVRFAVGSDRRTIGE